MMVAAGRAESLLSSVLNSQISLHQISKNISSLTYTFNGNAGSNRTSEDVGERVQVSYNSSKTVEIEIDSYPKGTIY